MEFKPITSKNDGGNTSVLSCCLFQSEEQEMVPSSSEGKNRLLFLFKTGWANVRPDNKEVSLFIIAARSPVNPGVYSFFRL